MNPVSTYTEQRKNARTALLPSYSVSDILRETLLYFTGGADLGRVSRNSEDLVNRRTARNSETITCFSLEGKATNIHIDTMVGRDTMVPDASAATRLMLRGEETWERRRSGAGNQKAKRQKKKSVWIAWRRFLRYFLLIYIDNSS